MPSHTRGFTLIELAIVLVVTGLIAGGIVVGQSLIRSSQIESVIGEVAGYKQAIANFQQKYMALPGDFAGAEAIWGSDASCPSTSYTSTPHVTTCNGNGDGHIGNFPSETTTFYETYRAWQHMANAGFITGSFNGISGTGSVMTSLIGTNIPASKLAGGGYDLYYVSYPTEGTYNWPETGHQLVLGTTQTANIAQGPIFTPEEALNIDNKLDDGLPAYGKVMAVKPVSGGSPNCTTSSSADASRYMTSYKGQACLLLFLTDL